MTRRQVGLAFQTDKAPGDYGRLAAMTEAQGADVFSLYGDLLYQPPLAGLLEAAAATSRVRLGPACLNPYTMHPYEIAGQIAALDRASAGRAYLGLARGAWLDAIGIDDSDPVARLVESAAVVELLLSGDTGGYRGEVFYIAPGVALTYQPLRRTVPLLIGGWGPRVLALAGRIASEAKVGGSTNPELAAIAVDRIGSTDTALVMGAVCVVDRERRTARRLARTRVAMYLDVVAGLDPTTNVPAEVMKRVRTGLAEGDPAAAGAAIPDEILDRFAFSGTPDDVAAQADQLFAAGVDRVDFGTPHGLSAEAGVELLGKAVIPSLR